MRRTVPPSHISRLNSHLGTITVKGVELEIGLKDEQFQTELEDGTVVQSVTPAGLKAKLTAALKESAKEMKETRPDIPCLFISGEMGRLDIEHARYRGLRKGYQGHSWESGLMFDVQQKNGVVKRENKSSNALGECYKPEIDRMKLAQLNLAVQRAQQEFEAYLKPFRLDPVKVSKERKPNG